MRTLGRPHNSEILNIKSLCIILSVKTKLYNFQDGSYTYMFKRLYIIRK